MKLPNSHFLPTKPYGMGSPLLLVGLKPCKPPTENQPDSPHPPHFSPTATNG
ncbi:hypothetical protein [Moorena sp. SIOASIH]|uniref:hypothetical protein n=1 Tax=Moorena sp. SIOASIH TaxID=2607817 RepID=UPI0025E7286C|nr:hypothetical protein [Moorena sp. SIOASIH]